MASDKETQTSKLPTSTFFSSFAATYARQTGGTTASLFESILPDIQSSKNPITSSSTVHDIAAGPGTATSVLLRQSPPIKPKHVLVSDNIAPMVNAARESLPDADSEDSGVECKELNACDLSSLPDASFSHNILNFSIFVLADPATAVKHIHRTLAPDGLAVLTTWKRFGVSGVVHRAQALIRPDLPPMPVPGKVFYEDGHLHSVVTSAGFDSQRVEVVQRDLVIVPGERLDALGEFLLGDFTKRAKEGWSEDEVARWPEAVENAIKEEVSQFGGIKFEAWAAFARK